MSRLNEENEDAGASPASLVRIIGNVEGQADNQFSQPRGVVVDPRTKTVFVIDNNNHRIQLFNLRSLAYIRTIPSNTQASPFFGNMGRLLNSPVGCCLDGEGHLYVSDTNNHRIVCFDHVTGELVRTISQQGSLRGFLNSPYGICVDSAAGYLYVADYHNHRIQVFDKDTGKLLQVFGSSQAVGGRDEQEMPEEGRPLLQEEDLRPGSGPGQFNEPIAVELDLENGRLLVADFSNNRVQVLNKTTGDFICQIGGGLSNEFRGPRGLAVERASKLLFISDRENHRIKLYNKDSYLLLRTIGSQGSDVLCFNRPMELCVCVEEGVLIAADGYNHRVQVIEIEELQDTKFRIAQRNKARQEKERRLKKMPKASRTAFDVDLMRATRKSLLGRQVLHFKGLGSLYDLEVAPTDCMGVDFISLVSGTLAVRSGTESRPAPLAVNGAMDKHAATFIGILTSVYEDSTACGPGGNIADDMLTLAVPPILAIHSLIERKWVPSAGSINPTLVQTLARVLQGLQHVAVDDGERIRIVTAVTSILRMSSHINSQIAESVFKEMLNNIRTLSNSSVGARALVTSPPTTHSAGSLQGLHGPSGAAEELEEAIEASLRLVCDVFLIDCSTSDQQRYRSRNLYQREVVTLMFGSSFLAPSDAPFAGAAGAASGHGGGTAMRSVPRELTELMEALYQLRRARSSGSEEDQSGLATRSLHALRLSADYLHASQAKIVSERENEDLARQQRTRGGRNIWREGEPMSVGDLVDAMDKEKCWFESIIVEVRPGMNVKVHFMGWGSKWDDVISIQDLSSRVAPLNTKTRDWRADLFEGGLIEIKCNEDTVYQKWMWGRIIAMNQREEWVDVSYSFSNEPPVLKRAALYGETICPVGMHTKDRSKAVLATIVRPPKKAEELVQRKEEGIDDVAFHDHDDELQLPEGPADDDFDDLDSIVDLSFSSSVEVSVAGEANALPGSPSLSVPSSPLVPLSSRGGARGALRQGSVVLGSPSHPHTPMSASPSPSRPGTRGGAAGGAGAAGAAGAAAGALVHGGAPDVLAVGSAGPRGYGSLDDGEGARNSYESVLQVSLILFESIMAEVVSVVSRLLSPDPTRTEAVLARIQRSTSFHTDTAASEGTSGDSEGEQFRVAIAILKELAGGPYRRLLAPYFCRVLIVQCGLRAKILTRGYLRDCPSSVSSAADFAAPCRVLQQIRNLETVYCQLLVRCLGDSLSMPLVRRVLLKLQATASRCGIAPLASKFCQQLSHSSSVGLRQIFIRDLLQNEQRFQGAPSALRSILLNLLPIASEGDVRVISKLWAEVLTRWVVDTCCDYARAHADSMHTPLSLIAFDVHGAGASTGTRGWNADSSRGAPAHAGTGAGTSTLWAPLLDLLQDMFEKARSVSRLEFHEADQCHLAAEIAFYRAFSALPDDVLAGISKMIAVRLAGLLDESPRGALGETLGASGRLSSPSSVTRHLLSPQSQSQSQSRPSQQNTVTKSIDRLVEFIRVTLNDHTSRYLRHCHQELMAVRLVHSEFSLNMERVVLQALPHMPRALTMLRDVEISSAHNLEFKKFLLNRIDEGGARISSSVVDLAFQSDSAGPNLSVNVLPSATWPELSSTLPLYRDLRLPKDMAVISAEFELYYSSLPSTWSDDEVNRVVDRDDRFRGTSIEAVSLASSGREHSSSSFSMGFSAPAHSRSASPDATPSPVLARGLPSLVSFLGVGLGGAGGPLEMASNRTGKRLSWCRSSGSVVLVLSQGQRTCRSFTTNEPMAAVLMHFNSCREADEALSTASLCDATGLSQDALSMVARDLCSCDPPLLEAVPGGYIVATASLEATSSTADAPTSLHHSSSCDRLCEARAGAVEAQWVGALMDAAITRVAKSLQRWVPFHDLYSAVRTDMEKRRSALIIDSARVFQRCSGLLASGVLVCRHNPGGSIELCEYCYYLHVDAPNPPVVPSSGEVFGIFAPTRKGPPKAKGGARVLSMSVADVYSHLTATLGITEPALSGEQFYWRFFSWLSRVPLGEVASQHGLRYLAPISAYTRTGAASKFTFDGSSYALGMTGPVPPFDFTGTGTGTGSGIGAATDASGSSMHVAEGSSWVHPGDDPYVRSLVVAASLSLCVGVAQIAKLEHALSCVSSSPFTDPARARALSQQAREVLWGYSALADEAAFRLLSSGSALEASGLHREVFFSLPSALVEKACSLFNAITTGDTPADVQQAKKQWSRRQPVSSTSIAILCSRGVISSVLGEALLSVASVRGVSPPRRGGAVSPIAKANDHVAASAGTSETEEAKVSPSEGEGEDGHDASESKEGIPSAAPAPTPQAAPPAAAVPKPGKEQDSSPPRAARTAGGDALSLSLLGVYYAIMRYSASPSASRAEKRNQDAMEAGGRLELKTLGSPGRSAGIGSPGWRERGRERGLASQKHPRPGPRPGSVSDEGEGESAAVEGLTFAVPPLPPSDASTSTSTSASASASAAVRDLRGNLVSPEVRFGGPGFGFGFDFGAQDARTSTPPAIPHTGGQGGDSDSDRDGDRDGNASPSSAPDHPLLPAGALRSTARAPRAESVSAPVPVPVPVPGASTEPSLHMEDLLGAMVQQAERRFSLALCHYQGGDGPPPRTTPEKGAESDGRDMWETVKEENKDEESKDCAIGSSGSGGGDKESPLRETSTRVLRLLANYLAAQVSSLHGASSVRKALAVPSRGLSGADEREERKAEGDYWRYGATSHPAAGPRASPSSSHISDPSAPSQFLSRVEDMLASLLRLTGQEIQSDEQLIDFRFAESASSAAKGFASDGIGQRSADEANAMQAAWRGTCALAEVWGAMSLCPPFPPDTEGHEHPGIINPQKQYCVPFRRTESPLFSTHGAGDAHWRSDSVGALLARVHCVATVTRSDAYTALFLLSLPSCTWSEEACINAYFTPNSAPAADAVFCPSDSQATLLRRTSTACTSLLAPPSSQNSEEGTASGVETSPESVSCASCGLTESSDLLCLSCSHWLCGPCWRTALLDQAALQTQIAGVRTQGRGQRHGRGAHGDGDRDGDVEKQAHSGTPPRPPPSPSVTPQRTRRALTPICNLHCPSCSAQVPPALCRRLFPDPEPLAVVSEFFAAACLEGFRAHLRRGQPDSDDSDSDDSDCDDEGGQAGPHGLGRSSVQSKASPARPSPAALHADAARAELHALSGDSSSPLIPQYAPIQRDDENSERWRGLLSRIGPSQFPAAVAENDTLSSQAINFGVSPPSNTLNVDRMAYLRLSEKFEGLKNAAAMKDSAFSGDISMLTSQKLRADAWDLLARSYRLLARSTRTHARVLAGRDVYSTHHRRSPQSAFLSGQALAHVASLLGPFKQYVGALTKTVEATAAQTCLEAGAEEAIRQLFRAVGMYFQSAQRIVRAERKVKTTRSGQDLESGPPESIKGAAATTGATERFSDSPASTITRLANDSLINMDEPFGSTN